MTEKLRIIIYTATIALFTTMVCPLCGPADNDLAALRKKAEAGDAQAQLDLGLHYQRGKGVDKDSAEAARWLRKAAEQDLPAAQFHLAGCCINGEGMTEDLQEGLEWLRRSAEHGYAPAQYMLGMSLFGSMGPLISKNKPEGVKWMEKAADQGNPEAQYKAGMLYLSGAEPGIPKNIPEGIRRVQDAAGKGVMEAQYNCGSFFAQGFGVNKDCGKAREWYLKAAEQGSAKGMRNQGVLSLGARGCPIDEKDALFWFMKALSKDPKDCLVDYNLACLSARQKHPEEALAWLRKALEKGYRNEKELRSDRDLEPLRDLSDYKALMHQYLPELK